MNDRPDRELAALDDLDPADLFAMADAAAVRAIGRVVGRALADDLERLGADDDIAAAMLAAWDQAAANEYDRAGLARLIRQRGLIP